METKTKIKNNKLQVVITLTIGLFSFVFFAQAKVNNEIQQNIINQVNQERSERGLHQLIKSELLEQAAKLKAKDMLTHNYFAHTSPNGLDPWHWLDEVSYQYKYAGENLAMDFSSASAVHKAWMKSPTHRDNILLDKYREIGVAVSEGVIDGRRRKIAVQFFGTPVLKEGIVQKISSELSHPEDEKKISINQKSLIKIKNASVRPWEETDDDEMLAYVKTEGEIKNVTVMVGEKEFSLAKLKKGQYLDLISLKEINLKDKTIIIKAEGKNNISVFYQIPTQQYLAYLEKKEERNMLATVIAGTKAKSNFLNKVTASKQGIFSLGLIILCLIFIANIWILEKEDEDFINKIKLSFNVNKDKIKIKN